MHRQGSISAADMPGGLAMAFIVAPLAQTEGDNSPNLSSL